MEASDRYEYIPIGYIYNFIGNTSAVKVLSHISNGGYAQVYKVSYGLNSEIGCLKRVIVNNKQALNILRAEVDCMRILKDNSAHIVKYIDSNASRFDSNGKYEVLLLMELCENGSLIDYMNTRLNNRFTEYEVLNIFEQTCRGIYAMHRLTPPLLHRDIKIENILINKNHDFKLCDFGSVCGIIRPPKNLEELNLVKNDLLSNTTAQYRPPEILQVAVNNQIHIKIDEKSDIWALGVYLYKLCYYTTPFEFNNSGNNGILSGNFKFPNFPKYSNNMKTLISWCLQVEAEKRPNICDLLEQICIFENKPCNLENFYKKRHFLVQQSIEKKHEEERENMKLTHIKQMEAFNKKRLVKLQANLANKNSSASLSASSKIGNISSSFPQSEDMQQLTKSQSLPSITTSSVDSYGKINNNSIEKVELPTEPKDAFSDLVTLTKLQRHHYDSTTDFDQPSSNGQDNKIKYSKQNLHKSDTAIASNTLDDSSIQKPSNSVHQRLQNLMNSDVEVKKSATGYGKYTNLDQDHNVLESNTLEIQKPPPKPPRPSSNSKPEKPMKPEALKAPPKPKKPSILKAEKLLETNLEKFEKKYPQI